VDRELRRRTGLWHILSGRLHAAIVQHNFALPPDCPMGHLSARMPGSRWRMVQQLNVRLGESTGVDAAIVDCDRISGLVGKSLWFDSRLWHAAKVAVSVAAQPVLARHNAAVLAAQAGLTRKCLALDLDNTLWGGVVAEYGLAGIRLGSGSEGEAFTAFQEYLLTLKSQGVLLCVCSKNNEADAREPFVSHPDMKLRMTDFVLFLANWEAKPSNLQRIAESLDIGLDSIVFVDDNPAERHAVRQSLPEVEVIPMPSDPALYPRAVADSLLFESYSFTPEDESRTNLYRARINATADASGRSLDEFYRSLEMVAEIHPFRDIDLPRIFQLVGKTNQFNITSRRHSLAQLRAFAQDPDCIHFSVRLRDRFADHGLVGVFIALRTGDTVEVDTWLMSCRVIGRTLEMHMMAELCRRAEELGCANIVATYFPTAKNALVSEIFPRLHFQPLGRTDVATRWVYRLPAHQEPQTQFIEILRDTRAYYDTASAT
jgi:FkbH-like protein